MNKMKRGQPRYTRIIEARALSIEIDGESTKKPFDYDGRFQTEFDDPPEDEESRYLFSGDRPADIHVNTTEEEWITRPRKISFDGEQVGADVKMEFETYLPGEEEFKVDEESKQEHVIHGKVVELLAGPDEISLTILIQFTE